MSQSSAETLLFIPVINEKKNLELLFPELLTKFNNADVLIVDDGSNDGTSEYIVKLSEANSGRFIYVRRENRLGIGTAHLEALKIAIRSKYKFLVTMDGDLTHQPNDAVAILKFLTKSNDLDLCIGSRFLKESNIEGWKKSRILITNLGHVLTRLVLRMNEDLSSGLRAYRVSSIPFKFIDSMGANGYDYFFKSAYIYKKFDLRIGEIKVVLVNRKFGKSKMNPKYAISGLYNLLKFRLEFYIMRRREKTI